MKYVLALDPSLSNTGIAIFDEKGTPIRNLSVGTNVKESHGKRLVNINDSLIGLNNEYNFCLLVCENCFTRFNKATQALYKVRGVIETIFADIENIYYSPMTIKRAITGSGKSTKEELLQEVSKRYPEIKFENYDACDAFCTGLTYFIEKRIIVK